MQKVAIVTDGSADLPKDLVMKYDIQIAPFKVIVDGEIYKMQGNYGDLTPQEFYNKLKNSKEYPTTAIPSPKDFDQAFKKGLQIAESVLAIVISEELSGTYQCALKVAEQFENEDITILDSRVATSTLGVLVVEAAKKAQQDASKEEIIDHLEKLIPKAQLVSVNDNVDAVYRSGRVGWVKKFLVDTFNVKPIIHFN
ncbi:MAG: DegV family protein, partial [Asgard group archaeon]|nr:DegV family protein [Asgard group archaeon]